MKGCAIRRGYRAVLKLALEHDAKPNLKLLLPSSLQSLVAGGAQGSLVEGVKQAFRCERPPFGLDLRQGRFFLHRNLNRGSIWNACAQPKPSTALTQPVNFHPNHNWFHGQLDQMAFCNLSVAELRGSGRRNELDVLQSMHQVSCVPTAEIYLQAMDQLGCREGAFPLVLQAFWLWEMYGRGGDHIALHKTAATTCILRSALLDARQQPERAAWQHPLGVWQALLISGAGLPDNNLSNEVISKVARATAKCSTRDEMQEMLACLKSVVRQGISHGVMLTTATHADLLRGYSTAADMKAAFDSAVKLASQGGSIPADTVVELLEWAAEEGDQHKVSFLEEELFTSGKGHYIAALNSPTC